MKKALFTVLITLMAVCMFVGCKNDEVDLGGKITVTQDSDETVYEYLYEATGSFIITNYTNDYYTTDSYYSGYTCNVYNDSSYPTDSYYPSKYNYKRYYSTYTSDIYSVKSGKIVKTTYKNKNYTKYEISINGYKTRTLTMKSTGSTTSVSASDEKTGTIATYTFYKCGNTYYFDEKLSHEIKINGGSPAYFTKNNLDAAEFELDIDDEENVRRSTSISPNTSTYYNYYLKYTGTAYRCTGSRIAFTKK